MDLPPPYHIEENAPKNYLAQHSTHLSRQRTTLQPTEKGAESNIKDILVLKQKVFEVMERLHGWCSKEKACLLMDIVFAYRPSTIVEIGVFGGKSLLPMAYALKAVNKKGTLYGIDPWKADKSAEGMDPVSMQWWLNVDHEGVLNGLLDEIYACKLEHTIRLLRVTSEECPPIPNIELLHIDGNHSADTSIIDVTKWVPLVKRGGIIVFDDVNWETTHAATAWLNKHCKKLAEYRGENVWGVWIKEK